MAKSKVSVAGYLEQQLAICGRSQKEIAEEVGYKNPNIITMFKTGKTKVPLTAVHSLSKAIGVDPMFFLRLVMTEYMPDAWTVVELIYGDQMSLAQQEIALVKMFRKVSGGVPVDMELPENVEALTDVFKKIAEREQAKAKASVERINKLPPNARNK